VLYGILIYEYNKCDSSGDNKLGEKSGLSQCVISKYLQSHEIFTNVNMVIKHGKGKGMAWTSQTILST